MGYDEGKMFSAVEDQDDGPKNVGYLNRRTGEILFLCPPGDEAWTGVSADELMDSQARVLKEPDDWLEIPKICNHPALRDIPQDQKVKDLLKETRAAVLEMLAAADAADAAEVAEVKPAVVVNRKAMYWLPS